MTSRRSPRRCRERGNVLVIVLVAMVGLAALGGVSVVAVRGNLGATGHHRFKAIAVYAAESGAAAGIHFLREQTIQARSWSTFVTPSNLAPVSPTEIRGNGARPGEDGNPFSEDTQAWYTVEILNNRSDPDYLIGEDGDDRLILRSTGYGPDGVTAQVEWEIRSNALGNGCTGQTVQKGQNEDGAGRNNCLGTIDATVSETIRPGG